MEGIQIEGDTDEEQEQRLIDQTRRKVAHLGRRTLKYILQDGYKVAFDNELPDDYEIISVVHDIKTDGIGLVIRSDEFEPVPDGMEYPSIFIEVIVEKSDNNQEGE